ncbi:glycosyltransferase [Helicobacter sp. CaF467b]|uniref:glycosyltransferase family 2 protein n=1 Tax=Helicobacter sp. CaF467b TaxID=2919923 RepID=UPI001F589455|nr:glycosyltransferase [Helicobacter sp. CaF467b]MCI2235397.1 glycosyltransferase [Helicobacter sp. CaF467b]
MQKPKISIVIPVYNVEKYIAECLESCINQTFKEIEIIVVDDCGSDRSIKIAEEFAKRDSRIKIVYNKENMKLMLARFEGSKIATADYIMFLDSDDFLSLDACEIAYKASKEGYYDLVSFGSYSWKQDKAEVFSAYESQSFQNLNDFSKWYYGLKYPIWNLCGRMLKKDIYHLSLKQLGVTQIKDKISHAEDVLAMFAVFNHCNTFIFLPEILYYYRCNTESITQNQSLQNLENKANDLFRVIKTMENFTMHNAYNKKLAKYFLSQAKHEWNIISYSMKNRNQSLGFLDKLLHKIYGRFYVIKRKIRTGFGK